MQIYSKFCRGVVLPLSDFLLGQDVSKRFEELRKFQWNSIQDIEAYRNERIASLVATATNKVAYYSEMMNSLGLSAGAIKTTQDLQKLPILDKQIIREQGVKLLDTTYRAKKYKMMSSGSTGTQTTVWADPASMNEVYATQLLFWEWGGFQIGQRHLQTGMSIRRGVIKGLKDLIFRCSYFSAFGLTDSDLYSMIGDIDKKKIDALFGYASSIYVLAKYLESKGQTRQLKSVFTWGDSLFPHYRQLIEKVFLCKVNDCYGLGEGLQCAAQCEMHEGLHEAMHGVVMEIVDGDGKPVEVGEIGRVIVTRLEHGCMPLIRYDTGDLASFIPGVCKCGRQLRLLSRIQGRSTDIVSTPSGDRLIVHFFTQLFELVPEILQFQVRQEQAEKIRILYVPGDWFDKSVLDGLKSQILANCKYPLEIEFIAVKEIPLEKSNKRRFVISNVPL